jgi:broad specificity phosphatase PhoE
MPALYVIRHAEPEIRGVLLGQCDPSLSRAGRRHASILQADVSVVYCSPLKRARETATFLDSWPVIIPDLAEISYGDWNGLSWIDIENRWPDLAASKIADWQAVTPPGGEPWQMFCQRITDALEKILTGPFPAAIVAHEAVNAVIANQLNGTPVNEYQQQYCEIKKYDL